MCSLLLYRLLANIFLKFYLAAYVWEAAPCSTLPTADENAVTESAVTSLFQLATVLTANELLYCSVLLPEILKPWVLQILCLVVLSELQPLEVVGWILLWFLSAAIREFSRGKAVMWPSTTL